MPGRFPESMFGFGPVRRTSGGWSGPGTETPLLTTPIAGRIRRRARAPIERTEGRLYDTLVIGGGIAGMSVAARLQAAGRATCVLEAHSTPGGCAGYFRRRGFAFDVGATTLVDFEPGGVGGELLETIGLPPIRAERLPGYVAWLPDRTVVLHRERELWHEERRRQLGDTPRHRAFWRLLDRLSDVFWRASRAGVRLPIRSWTDARRALRALGASHIPLLRYLTATIGDLLRNHGLREDRPLVGLLSMLIEDTVHSTADDAPAINAALGVTIRGAGLTRAAGGMAAFWETFAAHYRALGGSLELRTPALAMEVREGDFLVRTHRGDRRGRQVVVALPAALAAHLGPAPVVRALDPYLRRDATARGGAAVVYLGVPEREVAGQRFTHHQLLESYDCPLGEGNNMFVSVSAPGDEASAPRGHRTVMISTHCGLDGWHDIDPREYEERKEALGARLIDLSRRVYPELGRTALVREIGTPATFARFTRRPDGAVGGSRLTLANSNQRAIPHDLGIPGYRLAGDTTWPGLGTVACVLGSRIVAEDLLADRPTRVGRITRAPARRRAEAAVR